MCQLSLKVTSDKDLNFTPSRPIINGKAKFTDHYAIIVEMKNLPLSKVFEPDKKTKVWNLNKEEGWENYKLLTKENDALTEISKNTDDNAHTMLKNLKSKF